jgi:hypothetical protein
MIMPSDHLTSHQWLLVFSRRILFARCQVTLFPKNDSFFVIETNDYVAKKNAMNEPVKFMINADRRTMKLILLCLFLQDK